MITINLIPTALRKKGGPVGLQIPPEVVLGVGGVFVIVTLGIHLFLGSLMVKAMAEQQEARNQEQSVQPDKMKLDHLAEDVKKIKKELDVVKGITSKQTILWSHNLNAISDNMPKTIWLRKVYLENNNSFFIEGSSFSRTENQISLIGSFVTSLKEDKEFIKGFSTLEVNSIARNKRKNTDVADFVAVARLK